MLSAISLIVLFFGGAPSLPQKVIDLPPMHAPSPFHWWTTLDNEDGTATITITVRDTTNRPVTLLDEESLRVVSAADYATWDREVDPPLATLGELVSIEETAPGEYTLIWALEDGVYDVVVEVSMEVIEDLVLSISGNN